MAKNKASNSTVDAALALFNKRLATSESEERAARRVAKAERAKDEAARALKKIQESDRATSEEVAEAETAYRNAAQRWQTLRAGGDPDAATADEAGDAEAPGDPNETTPASTEKGDETASAG